MFDRVLKRLRERIQNRQFVMTLHAEDEMSDDGLSIYDIEHAILTGEIVERQKDRATTEMKYRIRGTTEHGNKIELITKIGPTGKAVIITVYAA